MKAGDTGWAIGLDYSRGPFILDQPVPVMILRVGDPCEFGRAIDVEVNVPGRYGPVHCESLAQWFYKDEQEANTQLWALLNAKLPLKPGQYVIVAPPETEVIRWFCMLEGCEQFELGPYETSEVAVAVGCENHDRPFDLHRAKLVDVTEAAQSIDVEHVLDQMNAYADDNYASDDVVFDLAGRYPLGRGSAEAQEAEQALHQLLGAWARKYVKSSWHTSVGQVTIDPDAVWRRRAEYLAEKHQGYGTDRFLGWERIDETSSKQFSADYSAWKRRAYHLVRYEGETRFSDIDRAATAAGFEQVYEEP